MNIKDLRNTATAGELCLINKVELLVIKEVEQDIKIKILDYIVKVTPPSKEDHRFDAGAGRRWFDGLEKHLNNEP